MYKLYSVLFLAGTNLLLAQESTLLDGRIYGKDNDVAGTHVINKTTKRATTTDLNGFFTIPVRKNDTLVFSAIQFKRQEIVISSLILKNNFLKVVMEVALTLLNEVIVMPYNLSGDLKKDMKNLKIEPVVTASTLGLPNAYVKVKTKNERRLFEADRGKFVSWMQMPDTLTLQNMLSILNLRINTHKILNRLSGRTQSIKRDLEADKKWALVAKVRGAYPDSVYVQELRIPLNKLDEFMYFCEADSLFKPITDTGDKLRMWEFMEKKSFSYRKINELE